MPDYFPENNTALWSDTEVRSLQKIVNGLGRSKPLVLVVQRQLGHLVEQTLPWSMRMID
jgi:hypothetical protein